MFTEKVLSDLIKLELRYASLLMRYRSGSLNPANPYVRLALETVIAEATMLQEKTAAYMRMFENHIYVVDNSARDTIAFFTQMIAEDEQFFALFLLEEAVDELALLSLFSPFMSGMSFDGGLDVIFIIEE